jgi:hypothetical protein
MVDLIDREEATDEIADLSDSKPRVAAFPIVFAVLKSGCLAVHSLQGWDPKPKRVFAVALRVSELPLEVPTTEGQIDHGVMSHSGNFF